MSEDEVIHLAVADRDSPGTCLRCGTALIPEPAGANLATIAAQAIAALDEHARVRAAQAAAAKPPQKRKKRR